MIFNRKAFFDSYRAAFGKLSQEQVNGLSFLLSAISADSTWKNLKQVAYFLATIDHETAHTFQPIKEKRERADSPRRKNQDRYWLTGYYGRGYIQLTWKANYLKFGLVSNPDKALEPETAYRIAARGMQQGLFTGKKLSEYINSTRADYHNARRVVNGLDRADLIAGRARTFEPILEASEDSLIGRDVSDLLLERSGVATDDPDDPAKDIPDVEVEPQAAVVDEPDDDKPSVETKGTEPPVIEVKPPAGSLSTKIAAAIGALGPLLAATGLKIGGVEFSAMSIIALCGLIAIGMIVGAILWDRDRNRQFERQKLSMNNLADRARNNVVAGQG